MVSHCKDQAIFSGRPIIQSKFPLLCIKFELIMFVFFNEPLSPVKNKNTGQNWPKKDFNQFLFLFNLMALFITSE